MSWSKSNLFGTGRPGQVGTTKNFRNLRALNGALHYLQNPVSALTPTAPVLSNGSPVLGEERTITLCSLWDVICDSLMYPSKRLGNGCNVGIQLAPSPGVEEGREVQSATKAKPQNQPRLIPRKTEKLHPGGPHGGAPHCPGGETKDSAGGCV